MAVNEAPNRKRPLQIKRGNVTVKIYSGATHADKASYPEFTIVYYSGTQRIRRKFADLGEAKREAELVATKLANGEQEGLTLTANDRSSYVEAIETLSSLNIPLNVAVKEYVHAIKKLPTGMTLREVVEQFLRRHPGSLTQKTVVEVVDELIASKEQAGRGNLHVADLSSRLGRFADSFETKLSQVTGPQVQQYLDGLKLSGRTRWNHLRHIKTLFKFAIRRRYLPKDALEELDAVERPEVLPTQTLIFTPEELKEMLGTCRPELVPSLAIGAFCGLRSAELRRLDWMQVNIDRRFVEVTALNAKTASRRLVPLCEAALSWLAPHRKPSGSVTYFSEENKFCSTIVLAVNAARQKAEDSRVFTWKKNGLRHSFCSYRLAATQDAAKTALEAGNSPTMIFKHYRELVTEEDAVRWFGIVARQGAPVPG